MSNRLPAGNGKRFWPWPQSLAPIAVGPVAIAAYLLAWALYWPANGPASGIQQPLYYNESYVWPMPWTLHQTAPGIPPPAPFTLRPGDTARQELVGAAGYLSTVRVWLAGQRGGEQVQAVLYDVEGGKTYTARFHLDEGGAGRYYRLRLPPIVDSEGKPYILDLLALEGTVIARVGYVDRLAGRLRLNEYPTPGDLDLTMYHHGPPGGWTMRAIGQRILPDLLRARVRQYKPAFFKGPAFAALLAGLALGVGLLLWALALLPASRLAGRGSTWIALAGLLLAGAIVFRWDAAGMLGLGRTVWLSDGGGPPLSPPVGRGEGLSVRDLVARLAFVERQPEPRHVESCLVELEGRRRACIAVPADSQVGYGLRVPYDGKLSVGFALPPQAAQSILFEVQVGGHTLLERALEPGEAGAWHDVALDLRPYAGNLDYLTLTTRPADVPRGFEAPGAGPPSGGPLPVAGLWAAPYVSSARSWLLPYPLPEPPQHEQMARFGREAEAPDIELLGYDAEWLAPSQVGNAPAAHPHGTLRLTLYWRALRPVDLPYTVFVHLLDRQGEAQGQWDSEPLGGTYPTDVWPLGVVVRDTYAVPVAEGASPDGLRAAVGLYRWTTMERLAAYDATGTPWPDGRVMLEIGE